MDPIDLAVYRFLSRDGVARFWAGRRVLDPRITPREIAEQVGISESSVRTRLQHLTARGFLTDRAVVPNPSLFRTRVFVADLPVQQPGEVDRILRDLALVDGVFFIRDVMDESDREIQVHFASESDATAARLAALLGRLVPGSAPVAARPYYVPACERTLSSPDWKVLQAVSRRPDASLAEVAEAAGLSVKTAARSYHQLIDARACWWTHGPNSEEFPLALVCADLRGPEHLEPTVGWVERQTEGWMPVASDGFGLEPQEAATVLSGLVPADVPTVLERFLRKLAAVEGVARIRRTFPLGSASYPAWFAARLSAPAPPRP